MFIESLGPLETIHHVCKLTGQYRHSEPIIRACTTPDVSASLVGYQLPPLTRQERATRASTAIATHFNDKQRGFVEFVLGQYVAVGVEELGADKLTPLLRLKYNTAIADALADLGQPEQIQGVFAGFQQYLYASGA